MQASTTYCGLRFEAECDFEREEIEPNNVTVLIDATDDPLPYRIGQAIWDAVRVDLAPVLWANARVNLTMIDAP